MASIGRITETKVFFEDYKEAVIYFNINENLEFRRVETGFYNNKTCYIVTVRKKEGFEGGN